MDLRTAYIAGMSQAFTNSGLLPSIPLEKVAQGAEIAAQATPQEAQMVGQAIGPQDLESMMKILEVLSILFEQYQAQMGGAPQGAGAPPPPGGMPPPPPPGGMPPPPPPPGGMPPPPPGGMPPM
jgi:hypothetical protein